MPDNALEKSPLVVGRRYVFEGLGEFEVLVESDYSMEVEDGSRLHWNSWVIADVTKGDGESHECLASPPHFGLSFAAVVEPGDRPARAQRFSAFCGRVTGKQKHYGDLTPRTDGTIVTTNSQLECWLDNGEGAEQHSEVGENSVLWIEETFVKVPEGEEDEYPDTLYLRARPVKIVDRKAAQAD